MSVIVGPKIVDPITSETVVVSREDYNKIKKAYEENVVESNKMMEIIKRNNERIELLERKQDCAIVKFHMRMEKRFYFPIGVLLGVRKPRKQITIVEKEKETKDLVKEIKVLDNNSKASGKNKCGIFLCCSSINQLESVESSEPPIEYTIATVEPIKI